MCDEREPYATANAIAREIVERIRTSRRTDIRTKAQAAEFLDLAAKTVTELNDAMADAAADIESLVSRAHAKSTDAILIQLAGIALSTYTYVEIRSTTWNTSNDMASVAFRTLVIAAFVLASIPEVSSLIDHLRILCRYDTMCRCEALIRSIREHPAEERECNMAISIYDETVEPDLRKRIGETYDALCASADSDKRRRTKQRLETVTLAYIGLAHEQTIEDL